MSDKIFLPLELPFTCVISGQTGCGKTQFLKKLLINQEQMFNVKIDKILYCYSIYQDVYTEMLAIINNLEFSEGMPDKFPKSENHSLLILDDLMIEATEDKRMAAVFSKMRHDRLSTIFITQNFYYSGKYMRTLTLNSQYLVLFPNFRDRSIYDTLGRQMFPHKRGFLSSAFEQATKKPYGYLFIDLKSNTDEQLRVREGIFPDDENVYVYI